MLLAQIFLVARGYCVCTAVQPIHPQQRSEQCKKILGSHLINDFKSVAFPVVVRVPIKPLSSEIRLAIILQELLRLPTGQIFTLSGLRTDAL